MQRSVDQNTKTILIIGGGFGGIAVARRFKKSAKFLYEHGYRVRLIDKNNYQLFHPSLYEVATQEAPGSSICLPFRQILGQKFDYIVDEAVSVNQSDKTVKLNNTKTKMSYDYLVMATGSTANYYNIPGMENHSISFKKIDDAIKVRENIDNLFASKRSDDKLWVIVGGGGFSGTELSAELMRFRLKLAAKYNSSPEKMEILLIEASSHLLNGLGEAESAKALRRLETLGVKVFLESPISKVTDKYVELKNGDRFNHDVFIWTGGVKPNLIESDKPWPTSKSGLIETDKFLRVRGSSEIYSIGDIAQSYSPDGIQHPSVAEIAEKSGKYVAENILRSISRQDQIPYSIDMSGYIVPISGKYSIAKLRGKSFSGLPAWIVQQLVFLRYLFKVLPLKNAVMRWEKFEQSLFSREP